MKYLDEKTIEQINTKALDACNFLKQRSFVNPVSQYNYRQLKFGVHPYCPMDDLVVEEIREAAVKVIESFNEANILEGTAIVYGIERYANDRNSVEVAIFYVELPKIERILRDIEARVTNNFRYETFRTAGCTYIYAVDKNRDAVLNKIEAAIKAIINQETYRGIEFTIIDTGKCSTNGEEYVGLGQLLLRIRDTEVDFNGRALFQVVGKGNDTMKDGVENG